MTILMPIATLIPGASYSSGTYTIPISALNTALTNDWTSSSDDASRLIYCLLQILEDAGTAGTVTQQNCSCEVSSSSVASSTWESTTDTYVDVTLRSKIVSFAFDETITSGDPDTLL